VLSVDGRFRDVVRHPKDGRVMSLTGFIGPRIRVIRGGRRRVVAQPTARSFGVAPSMQHPVPPEVLMGIGDIVVSFALLENAVEALIGSLILEHRWVDAMSM
jgi:hypothetical protein